MQLTASTIRLHLAATAPSDGLFAVKVAPFFKSKLLPLQLRGVGVTEAELREELEDGIEYKRSDQGKLAIKEKRIHLLAIGCSTPYLALHLVTWLGLPPSPGLGLDPRDPRLRLLRPLIKAAAEREPPSHDPRANPWSAAMASV